MIITFTLSLVKFSTFLINTLLNFSFPGEYGNLIEKVFLSSNNHSCIIISSYPLSKLQIVWFVNFNGHPAFRYFCLILSNCFLKSDTICLAQCSSLVIALRLYPTGIFELQCTSNFVELLKTCLVISAFSLTNYASRNFFGLTSNISFIFLL